MEKIQIEIRPLLHKECGGLIVVGTADSKTVTTFCNDCGQSWTASEDDERPNIAEDWQPYVEPVENLYEQRNRIIRSH